MNRERLARLGARLPKRVRWWIQRYVDAGPLKRAHWKAAAAADVGATSDVDTFGSPCRVGIVFNQWGSHQRFVDACLELGVPYVVLDLARNDWGDRLRAADCGLLLTWPDALSLSRATMLKDRVQLAETVLGIPSVPSSHELWLYEDKRRVRDWLATQGLPSPRTWLFFERDEALAFAESCDLPVVFKLPMGSSARGVTIARDRRTLVRVIRRTFDAGIAPPGHHHRDRFRGSALLQEFLPTVREWRLVRIGSSYFGHPKGRVGDFHSGSGVAEWDVPTARHLDFLHDVTERGRFFSMAVDTFETTDGRLLVNELQTVFGATTSVDQLRVDGVPGRMVRLGAGDWRFEPGDFAKNACAHERVRQALEDWRRPSPLATWRSRPATEELR